MLSNKLFTFDAVSVCMRCGGWEGIIKNGSGTKFKTSIPAPCKS